MKAAARNPLFGRLLMGLGGLLILAALLLFFAGLSARQSIAEAERLAVGHADELAAALLNLQDRLAAAAAEINVGAGQNANDGLIEALDRAALAPVLSAQVFGAVLEDLPLGEYPGPDFTTLEMLLEARRSGRAMPEGRLVSGQPAHLALAHSLQRDDGIVSGIVLVRLPIERLTDAVSWSVQFDFLSLTQGLGERRTEVWHQGSRPSADPARTAVPGSRFWLEWHHSPAFPLVGLQEAIIMGLSGITLLLFGLRLRSPGPAGRSSKVPSRLAPRPAAASTPDTAESVGPKAATPADPAAPAEMARAEAPEPSPRQEPRYTPDAVPAPEAPLDQRAETGATDTVPVLAPADYDMPKTARRSDFESGSGPAAAPPVAAPSGIDDLRLIDDLLDAAGEAPMVSVDEACPEVVDPEPQAEPPLAGPSEDEATDAGGHADDHPAEPADPADPERASASEPSPDIKPETAPTSEDSGADPTASTSAQPPAPVEPRLFTDAGILGRFDAGLDARSVTLIGQAIAALAVERGIRQIAVGRDGRLHGPVLITALTQGLCSGGVDVLEFGALPSPLLDYAALELPGQSSVMVSAAQLPGDWNGLRVMLQGQLMVGQDVQDLLERLRVGSLPSGQGALEAASVLERYVQAVTARIQLERPLKVVVDCANSVAGLLVPRLLAGIGADVVPLYADVDGTFPHHPPDPSRVEHLEDLRLCVRNFRADIGLAFGGDGDRVVIVGSDGKIFWPDRMLLLLAQDLIARQPGATVVLDAMCSPRVAEYLKGRGAQIEVCGLGPASVAQALERGDGALGATFAGQFLLSSEWNRSADALFAACKLLEILSSDTREVADTLAELPSWISLPPVFLPTRPTSPDRILTQLLESADVSDAEVGSDNGFSIDVGNAWTRICRSADGSGLLIRFEGDDDLAVERLRTLVRQLLLAVDERMQIPF